MGLWRWLGGPLIALLAGCSGLSAPASFNEHNFKGLVDNQRFVPARDMLQRADATAISSRQRSLYREYLDLAVGAYELQTLQQAGEYERAGQWFEAEKVYRAGRDRVPRSTALEGGYRAFDRHRQAYADQLRTALRLHRARLLPLELDLTAQIAQVFPDDYALENQLAQLRHEAGELVAFMKPLAQTAFVAGRLDEARSYDTLILRLGESPVSRERLNAIDKRVSQAERERSIGQQQVEKKQRNELWRAYDRAVTRGDYAKARQVLRQIDRLGFQGPVARQEQRRLEGLIQEKSAVLISEGKEHYTQGQLDDALKNWREALVLVPDDPDLLTRIKRAETFQANYQRLSE